MYVKEIELVLLEMHVVYLSILVDLGSASYRSYYSSCYFLIMQLE